MQQQKLVRSAVPWKDENGRELLNRDPGPGTLRQQLKRWGTPEEKEIIRRLEAAESAELERKRQEQILSGEHQPVWDRQEIVPDFNKHDLKKEW